MMDGLKKYLKKDIEKTVTDTEQEDINDTVNSIINSTPSSSFRKFDYLAGTAIVGTAIVGTAIVGSTSTPYAPLHSGAGGSGGASTYTFPLGPAPIGSITTVGGGSGGASTYTFPLGPAPIGSITTVGGGFTASASYVSPTAFTLRGNGKEIVSLNDDGSVIWKEDINIDEAAEAFSKSIALGGELLAGITKSVKLKMRDSVFEDLIMIAKEKGSLTAEDLTYLLSASKIVEKLQGGRDK